MTPMQRSFILHMIIATSLYVLFALLDVHFTLVGINGDISMEGNPIMRYMMANFGLMGGLIVEKTIVLLGGIAVAVVAVMGIAKEAEWIFYLAFTRATRNWMKRKKRYWVAFLPLYFVAFSQGLAAAAWIHLTGF